MLEIKNISKTYKTGNLVQKALDGVSLNLRDNEFVAILGPSGSGKTTLLNIIGGLDRYDSGDLIINHVSTKNYKDKDWDSYRNHTIGFVFQSYNLIPHQTVLANVELALTISGISKKERTRRALAALEEVGLKEQAHKKPNQMSGGQMQRVAIARALVNNPDILLADEPTGALDSKTSYQVMELLKKVAKDRLVVMVSHNPDLSEEYATRVVKIKDGKIIDDSDPYIVEEEVEAKHKNLGKAKMGILTALSLSFNNLVSKKGRTILTAFAGSIGIIGIALILSLSAGFQNYIDQIQEETMASYPLTIDSNTTNIFSAIMGREMLNDGSQLKEGFVKEIPMITTAANSLGTNDLKTFKKWLEDNEEIYIEDINKIDYQYDVSPLIYSRDATGEIVQLNPSTMLSGIYSDSAMSMVSSMMQGSAMMGAFYEEDYNNLSDYELLRGTYPSAYDEVLVVLNNKEMIPDLIVYSLGLRDTEELSALIQQVMNGEEVTIHNEQMMISYDDLLTLDFRLINATDLYKYNEKYDTYEDMNDDEKYIEELYSNAHKLKITGIAYSEGNSGVIYSKELTSKVINDAYNTEIVQKQLNNKDIDVFSNTAFDEDKKDSGLDFNDLVTIDEDLLKEAFIVNISEDDFDFDMMDEEKMQEVIMGNAKEAATAVTSGPNVTQLSSAFTAMNTMMLDKYIDVYESTEGIIKEETLSTPLPQTEENSEENNNESNIPDVKYLYLKEELLDAIASNITGENYKNALTAMASQAPEEYKEYVAMLSMLQAEDYDNLAASVKTSFYAYYKPVFESSLIELVRNENGETVAKKILYTTQHQDIQGQRIEITIYGNPMSESKKVSTDLISSAILDETAIAYTNKSVNSIVNNYATYMVAASIGKSLMSVMEPMQDSFSELGDKFSGDIFEFDTEKFKEAFQFEMDEEELSRLMSSMIKSSSATYKNNLKNLGYQDENDPSSISFYFKDFDSKNHFMNILDEYNENVDEEYKISYTDITGLMMSSVATIIDSVTYVLIAFVSISLIVSSIMIAVITLISVMERTKEIGILRAMGASKSNVSSIFTAETFIIGFLSGSLGILVSYLALIPINMVIHNINTDITAVLEIQYAVILIAISVALTLVSGLIPSRKAAKQDPVIALRSE
ncbi:MAG: ABC transporter ATP-binding protein/permease [Erysipelotrichaceae bacterium]|nr:ABC transporter ATP-binding protein/permease [Erysipelotrichaceae bacterium]